MKVVQLAAASGFALALALGCGSEEEKPKNTCATGGCPVDYSTLDLQIPAVSLEQDVMPIFRRGCGFSVCHGSQTKPAAELHLGPACPKASEDPTCMEGVPDLAGRQEIIDAIVGVASKTAPEMPIVTAGSPEQSFLMLKMDGCHNSAGLACTPRPGAKTNDPCGDSMPQTSGLLCDNERTIVRRWIAQGAQNN